LHEDEYRRLLLAAGFTDISIEPTRVYSDDDVKALLDSAGLTDDGLVEAVEGKIMSAFVRGTKAQRNTHEASGARGTRQANPH
jgi:hypothetical protein